MSRWALFRLYWKLQSIITPGLRYSEAIYEDILDEYCAEPRRWLDLGCGHRILPAWRLEREETLVDRARLIIGIDYDYLSLTKHKTIRDRSRADIRRLPFPDNTFDLITASMVFEHLEDPELQLTEIRRVLSAGGRLIFHTPNKSGYSTLVARAIPESIKGRIIYALQGRREEDVFPTFYRINSPTEIERLAKLSGLRVERMKLICSAAQFVVVPPLVLFELIYIRFLMSRVGRPFRTNIIAVLEKV